MAGLVVPLQWEGLYLTLDSCRFDGRCVEYVVARFEEETWRRKVDQDFVFAVFVVAEIQV
jgi:hypothetical protein